MTIRFGIVGCGMIANFHAKALYDTADAKLVACTSRSNQSANDFANKHGCTVFASVAEMLTDGDIDAVSICSPSGAHLDPALLSAEAGKHVVIEKPLEVTPERCDQIIKACDDASVVLSTIFQSRFHQSSQLLKQAIDAGRFGKIALANAYVKWFRTQEYYDSGAWRGTWKLDGGGALMNQAIHNVDLLQWMMGPVSELHSYVATLSHERIEVEDTAVASLRFANGALGTIEATTSAWPGSLKRLEVHGSQGTVVIEDEDIRKWEFAEPLPEDDSIREQFASQNKTEGGASDPSAIDYSGHKSQFEDIIKAIQSGTQPLVNGVEAKKSVQIISAIYESARLGKAYQFEN